MGVLSHLLQHSRFAHAGLKDTDADAALTGFQQLFELAQAEGPEQSDWAFKALKQTVKLHSRRGDAERMVAGTAMGPVLWRGHADPHPVHVSRAAYTRLLGFINSAAVSKNRAEKAINSILDKAGEGAEVGGIYSVTLAALSGAAVGGGGGNERLLFKTRMKLGRVLLARGAYAELATLVVQLEDSVAAQGGLQGALASGPPGGGGGGGGWMGWGPVAALLCYSLCRRSDGRGGLRR